MIKNPPKGLIADLATPLDRNGRIDGAALGRLIARVKPFCQGLLVGGVNVGEGLWLTIDERLELLGGALKNCRDGPAIFFEAACRTEEEALELILQAEHLLQRAASPQTPVFYHLTPLIYMGARALPRHFKKLSRLTKRFFILSNNPGMVGEVRSRLHRGSLAASIIKKLAADGRLVGADSLNDSRHGSNYQKIMGNIPEFRIYNGSEPAFLKGDSSSGLISSCVQISPRSWAVIVRSSMSAAGVGPETFHPEALDKIWKSGRIAKGLHEAVRPNPPALIKAALYRLRVLSRPDVKNGRPPATPEDLARLDDFLMRIKSGKLKESRGK